MGGGEGGKRAGDVEAKVGGKVRKQEKEKKNSIRHLEETAGREKTAWKDEEKGGFEESEKKRMKDLLRRGEVEKTELKGKRPEITRGSILAP